MLKKIKKITITKIFILKIKIQEIQNKILYNKKIIINYKFNKIIIKISNNLFQDKNNQIQIYQISIYNKKYKNIKKLKEIYILIEIS